jgi:spermidine synthase
LLILVPVLLTQPACATVIYEVTSPYHHIRVKDEGEFRILSFDDAPETRISLKDPLQGHFEYTEYFHMAWLWNTQLNHVLMIGLGGGSAQRAFEHYYPRLSIETAEIDRAVVEVLENEGKGLNLTWEAREGIVKHESEYQGERDEHELGGIHVMF